MKQPTKELRFEWTTFRDRLQPGSSETWKLRVLTPDGKLAPAQVMAAMYDASLDQIRPHSWFLRRFLPMYYPSSGFNGTDFFGRYRASLGYTKPLKPLACKFLSFDGFNHSLMAYGGVRNEVITIAECSMMLSDAGGREMAYGKQKAALNGRIAGLDLAAPQAAAKAEAVEEDAVDGITGETAASTRHSFART